MKGAIITSRVWSAVSVCVKCFVACITEAGKGGEEIRKGGGESRNGEVEEGRGGGETEVCLSEVCLEDLHYSAGLQKMWCQNSFHSLYSNVCVTLFSMKILWTFSYPVCGGIRSGWVQQHRGVSVFSE